VSKHDGLESGVANAEQVLSTHQFSPTGFLLSAWEASGWAGKQRDS